MLRILFQYALWVARESPSAQWYSIAMGKGIVPALLSADRRTAVASHRLRLGYKCLCQLDEAAHGVLTCTFCDEE